MALYVALRVILVRGCPVSASRDRRFPEFDSFPGKGALLAVLESLPTPPESSLSMVSMELLDFSLLVTRFIFTTIFHY